MSKQVIKTLKKDLSNLILTGFLGLLFTSCQMDKTEWKMAEVPIKTKWAETINPESPWPEYPRPQLVRENWQNLNGLWKYAIQPADKDSPSTWDGNILVPFPVESALSGVKKQVGKDSLLWYLHQFTIPSDWHDKRVLLHFEAVDWMTTVWINEKKAGTHKGGYDPFTFDITDLLNSSGKQKLKVSVWDPTSDGTQPRGKQVNEPDGIWYTSTTGIWQTVWIEPVPESFINSFQAIPDIDNQTLSISIKINNIQDGDKIRTLSYFDNTLIDESIFATDDLHKIPISDLQQWTPDTPNLYDLKIQLLRGDEVIDEVSSYFGMRKISLEKDENGNSKIFLNNEFVFQNGPLDQGFWPDGLYTPPSDEAMKFDLDMIKAMGFNMLRKHVKIEPRRFYTWCDKMGILVWQDMPSGDRYIGPNDQDIERTDESAEQFEWELTQLIKTKFNHPSIIIWVPFNEGWGQYKTAEAVSFIKNIDPSRLVNSVSGWADRGVSDILDLHHYPEPICPEPEKNRAIVLGEFGGLGLALEGHTWVEEAWGYRNMQSKEELLARYEEFYTKVWTFMNEKGLSAAVYTQITDVETETNGLLTYDRKVIKLDTNDLRKINTGKFTRH